MSVYETYKLQIDEIRSVRVRSSHRTDAYTTQKSGGDGGVRMRARSLYKTHTTRNIIIIMIIIHIFAGRRRHRSITSDKHAHTLTYTHTVQATIFPSRLRRHLPRTAGQREPVIVDDDDYDFG